MVYHIYHLHFKFAINHQLFCMFNNTVISLITSCNISQKRNKYIFSILFSILQQNCVSCELDFVLYTVVTVCLRATYLKP